MKDFAGKIAVITGGGAGIGRELARQLVTAGAHVALCDVFPDNADAALAACRELAPAGVRVSAHVCDVADEPAVLRFRDELTRAHGSSHIDLLFNNAGIGGGASFLIEERARWERTFNVNWLGVYHCTRAFLPLLLKSQEGWIVNTSSVHGFLAFEPGGNPQSAYSTAKFAIKGFSEALLVDLRQNAPHVHVALVMPGHIGTSIVENTIRLQGGKLPHEMSEAELATARERMRVPGAPDLDDEALRALIQERIDAFRLLAPLTPGDAAGIILDGVRAGRWRILVGRDANTLDALVREHPEEAYAPSFLPRINSVFSSLQGPPTEDSRS